MPARQMAQVAQAMEGGERVGMSRTNLLELLNGTLVDATALVDEMAGL